MRRRAPSVAAWAATAVAAAAAALAGTGGCSSSSGAPVTPVSTDAGDPGTGGGGDPAGSGGAAGGPVVVSPVPDGMATFSGPYVPPPEATRQPGVPTATLDRFVFAGGTPAGGASIFPNTLRDVAVFIPAQYLSPAPVPFMVIQDGDEQLASFKTDIVLENLIDQGRLPVMAAVFVHNPDNFGAERSLEYDCLDADYETFVLDELLPEVRRRHPELVLTEDPDGRGALGKSSGGPASFTLGWLRPDQFQRILTLNGSFVNLCKNGPGANSYPALIQQTDPKPLQVYLFSGTNDNLGFAAGNQAMADALASQGYRWRYVFGEGAAHGNQFGAALMTEALLWIWAGYPIR